VKVPYWVVFCALAFIVYALFWGVPALVSAMSDSP
jgi:hypothetical protein